MKRIASLLALCIMGTMLLFAQRTENEEKPESDTPVSTELKALETAYTLAEYGYSVSSASALIEAAEILSQVSTQPLTDAGKEGSSATAANPSGHDYSVEQLLADGKKLAAGDKTLTKWANEVEKTIKKGTRGALGGPKWDIDCASGGGSFRYTISFQGRAYAEVSVQSLDGCDYDVFIYDEGGNLITSDASYSSSAYASFVPRWTGAFTIVVKNSSRYAGRYKILTN